MGIGIQEIKFMITVIDIMCERGALRGNELFAITTLYGKLTQMRDEQEKREQMAPNEKGDAQEDMDYQND